ncbi:hypothetical protein G6M26_02170 [Agrobacterium tumefaciens]|nr:hypothetical protein [Agrobacterium tumefaciens]NTE17317.1 hypothetical protein [Agrobacterium tumefaciens]
MEYITNEIILNVISEGKASLFSSHARLSIPIINRIYKKMINDIKFDDIKICDHLIIDGHHRYISSLLANINLGSVKSHRTLATLEYDWKNVEFVEEEWDTKSKIKFLNKQDAAFNQITLNKIIEITK